MTYSRTSSDCRTDGAAGGRPYQKVFHVNLPVAGGHVRGRVGVTAGNGRLSDLVPLARWISDQMVAHALDALPEGGAELPCSRGCDSCCHYLVPLSVPPA